MLKFVIITFVCPTCRNGIDPSLSPLVANSSWYSLLSFLVPTWQCSCSSPVHVPYDLLRSRRKEFHVAGAHVVAVTRHRRLVIEDYYSDQRSYTEFHDVTYFNSTRVEARHDTHTPVSVREFMSPKSANTSQEKTAHRMACQHVSYSHVAFHGIAASPITLPIMCPRVVRAFLLSDADRV